MQIMGKVFNFALETIGRALKSTADINLIMNVAKLLDLSFYIVSIFTGDFSLHQKTQKQTFFDWIFWKFKVNMSTGARRTAFFGGRFSEANICWVYSEFLADDMEIYTE